MIYITENDKGNYEAEERFTSMITAHNDMLLKKYYKVRHMEGLSIYTLENYMSILRILSRTNGKMFEKMDTKDIRDFLSKYQTDRNVSNYTLDGHRIAINTFFEFLVDEEFINKNPCKKIKKIKFQRKPKEAFTDEEIAMLKDACINLKEKAVLDIFLSSGCRVSEIAQLDISDIDFENREFIIIGKGGKYRTCYFDASTKVHLQRYLEERTDGKEGLFVQEKFPHERISRYGYRYILDQIGERAGVVDVYPHKFRRTFATRMLDKGMPLEQVKELLGHTNVNTTLVYAKVNRTDLKNNHRRYSN